MKRTIAWIALFALTMGCASGPAPIGSKPLLAIDPAAVEGTWALTDERNQTFNVILREDGSATSTWSRGMDGAKGEQGGWSIRDGVLFVRWTDGWLDTIRVGRFGFEKFSYEPSDRDSDTPSSTATQSAARLIDSVTHSEPDSVPQSATIVWAISSGPGRM